MESTVMNETATKQSDPPPELTRNWWTELQESPGGRAELRRAQSLAEIVLIPAYNDLRIALIGSKWNGYRQLALVAGVLAQVKTDTGGSKLGAQLAAPRKSGQGVRLSGLRFRRLIQHKGHDELLQPMIRVVRLLDRAANVADLAETLYWWSDRTRRELAFAYYDKASTED
jgi:CRISPR system Cascade subunit CasB